MTQRFSAPRVRRTAAAIVLVAIAATATGQQPSPSRMRSDDAPHASAPRTIENIEVASRLLTLRTGRSSADGANRLLDRIAALLVLQFGYAESAGESARAASVPGLTGVRAFDRFDVAGRRVVELALSRDLNGNRDVLVFGYLRGAKGELDNRDLQRLLPLLELVVASSPGAPGPVSTARMTYQLSYVQADQAVALLKALGFSTVEFTRQVGDSDVDVLYQTEGLGSKPLPAVIKAIDASKTSLMDPFSPRTLPGPAPPGKDAPPPMPDARKSSAIPDIGGTYLHRMTSGEPAQRLIIVYDRERPEDLEDLLSALEDQIDVPARQVVISALIVEINSDRARELGITFAGGNSRVSGSLSRNEATATDQPFTLQFDSAAPLSSFEFSARLSALVKNGEAEILSNPSILVLDGRQARIQVGKQVPVVNSTSTAAGITSSVEYFPVGIVLNLRPRITDDNADVTMQVETIVSAVAQNTVVSSQVFYAPTIDNRQVQTFVRVADNTPFIIGGLVSTDSQRQRTGIPKLSTLPVVGNLFGRTTNSSTRREVIVVLTPHIVPINERSFSYVIPKDSDTFDTFGYHLFRNAYRIRNRDIFDLRFVSESQAFQQLVAQVRSRAEREPAMKRTEPWASLLDGRVPGEEILVRRMLWEIIKKLGVKESLGAERILFFEPSAKDPASTDFKLSFLKDRIKSLGPQGNAIVLTFDAETPGTAEHPFVQPKATVSFEHVTRETYEEKLLEKNARAADGTPLKYSIIISDEYWGTTHPLEVLQNVLILKRLLALNTSFPLTIKEFRVGRQIIFPTEQDIAQSIHVIDREAAKLFYEVMEYYRAFESEFSRKAGAMVKTLRDEDRPAAPVTPAQVSPAANDKGKRRLAGGVFMRNE